jgi:3-oxoadipate enol-lactonase
LTPTAIACASSPPLRSPFCIQIVEEKPEVTPRSHQHVRTSERPDPEAWLTAMPRRTVQTEFGDIVVRIADDGGKPFMVFWPSLLLDSSMWSRQVEHYAPGYRIVLIDPPGIGESAPLRHAITVNDSAVCFRQILDGLGIGTCIAVGNSWGSLTAAVFAADHPDRLDAAILTNGTAAPPTAEILGQMTEMVAQLEQCETAPDWLLAATRQAFSADVPDPEFMTYLGRVLREDPVSIAFAMKNILLGREDLHPTMRRIRNVPVLVVAGEQDHVFDVAQSRSLASSIDGSEFVLLPATGHLAPRQNPKVVNAAIDKFLSTQLAAPDVTFKVAL